MKKILFTLSVCLLLVSCSKMAKKNLGLTEEMPDEFQVQKVRPLEVPPHFNSYGTAAAPRPEVNKERNRLSKAEEAVVNEADKE